MPSRPPKGRKPLPPTTIQRAHTIRRSDQDRIRAWAKETISKHESKLSSKHRDGQIVWRDAVEAEAVDVRLIYPYRNLNYIIFRNGDLWSIRLCNGNVLLLQVDYAKI